MRDLLISRMREVPAIPKHGQLCRSETGVRFLVEAVTGIPLNDPDPDYYVVAGTGVEARRTQHDRIKFACMLRQAKSGVVIQDELAECGELIL